MKPAKAIVVSTEDGATLVSEVLRQLAGQPVSVSTDLVLPDPWDAAAVVVALTPALFADSAKISFLNSALGADIPIVPVVESLSTYRFSDIPHDLTVISDRNAVGIRDTDGPGLLETIGGYLGLEAFARNKKVFISYRRKDAKEIAEKIYDYLWSNHYQAFLDTRQIEGGAEVQTEIMLQIEDKDIVLLLDSPEAASSEWVQKEIVQALARRIPVCVVSIGDHPGLVLTRELKRVTWDQTEPHNLEQVRLLVSRGIASRELLDSRVRRVVNAAATSRLIAVQEVGRREIVLARKSQKVLLQYEDAPITLERLHRLYIGYKARRIRTAGLYVSGEAIILPITTDAVIWARGRARLEAVPLVHLYLTISQLFP